MTVTESGVMFETWQPAFEKRRGVFIAVHGLGAHSGRWEFFAADAVARGYAVYAIELSGFGRTAGLRGHIDSFEYYYRDVTEVAARARGENAGAPVYVIGESMGGLIAYLMAVSPRFAFDGYLCLSPAFKSLFPYGPLDYLDFLVSYFLRGTRQYRMPFTSDMCTRDPGYRQVMDAHAAENRVATARTIGTIFFAQLSAMRGPNRCTRPVLFLVAGADTLVDPAASESVFNRLAAPDKTLIRYPEMYHALSVDLGRERVFADLFAWVEKRSGGQTR